MYSKFLYHSLCESAESGVCMINHGLLPKEDKTVIPDPLPKPVGSQTHRDVLWTFEDIKMLIGTDLPVFCDDSYCVSLRLSDMRTPVNVLTGLDYWLDNLMCNVPEVAMCFHVNGIVQKYEIVKTEDIPHLENSRFDPCVVTDIATNILSFLKNNATKEGHTYWLYKGTNDDVVKLYDLTTVCSDMENTSEQNPFIVPLGMLLYRVARNMWTNDKLVKASLIRTLLENCLCLLDEKKHSQVCTSASYLLSDIYVPDKSLEDDWSLPGESPEESTDEESGQETEENKMSNSVDVKALSKTGSMSRSNELVRLKPFNETVDERCVEAVKCIYRALVCLEYDLKVGQHKKSRIVEEQAKCDSDTAIPLHYEPLKRKTATLPPDPSDAEKSRSDDLQMTSFNKEAEGQQKGQTWHQLSKGLLFRKAAVTFSAMTRGCMNKGECVKSVKYLKLAMVCLNAMKAVIPHKAGENDALLSNLLGLCGDIQLVLTKSQLSEIDWDTLWKTSPVEENGILEMAEKEFESFEYEEMFKLESLLDSLTLCIDCYKRAIDLISKKRGHVYIPLCKRKGNALNELGVYYMQSAQKLLETEVAGDKPSQEMMTHWMKGRQAFSQGIEVFEEIEDIANQALLHCNYGRLMRLCATTYTQIALKSEKQEFTPKERHYFQMAIDEYKKALSLGSHGFRNIVESVRWELSTTYFNMASLLQDYAPLSSANKEEIENEVTNLMDCSLKYCREDSSFASQPMYQFRIACINHRLASLFHNTIRGNCSEQKKRHLRQLSEKHYIQALKLYQQMECHMEFLRAQLEYIALLERGLTGQANSRNLKILQQMLQCLANCQEPLRGLVIQLSDTDGQTKHQQEGETISDIIEERLQFVLQQLVKVQTHLHTKKSASKQKSSTLTEVKALYAKSLNSDSSEAVACKLQSKCSFLETLLEQISNFCHKKGAHQEAEVT
ncbi:erythroid differentiation-related factor 1-like isoform X2 [Mercenaria mercenaria]|nr:erythroid differentiation-related factor 1-like isoform X2 [Mercenaria mercenaria]